MIGINLLPTEYRKRVRPPVGWILVSLACAGIAVLALIGAGRYRNHVIPSLQKQLVSLKDEETELLGKTGELDHTVARMSELERYVETMVFMYNRRIIWSRFLQDVKQAVLSSNKAAAKADGAGRIALTRVAGYGRTLYIDGNVDAPEREKAIRFASAVIDRLLKSTPPASKKEKKKNGETGLGDVPLRQLMADGWPRLVRVEPVSGNGNEAGDALQVFDFAIEILLK